MDDSSCSWDTLECASVEDPDWVMYADRPEWRDVLPIPQEDSPATATATDDGPVVRIAYSSRFVDVYDRVRAVLASGEVSRRVLRLLSAAIELNPANYSAWQARRRVLSALLATHSTATATASACSAPAAASPTSKLSPAQQLSPHQQQQQQKHGQHQHQQSEEQQQEQQQNKQQQQQQTKQQQQQQPEQQQPEDEHVALLRGELYLSRRMMELSAKNYQLWHHRRWAVEQLASRATTSSASSGAAGDDSCQLLGASELRITELALAADAKNFHVWQYRQWVLDRFRLWPAELALVDRLLDTDVLNNSAWNQRYCAVARAERARAASEGGSGDGEGGGGWCDATVAIELEYCQRRLLCEWDNEAVWNYVRGVVAAAGDGAGLAGSCPQLLQLVQLVEEHVAAAEQAVDGGGAAGRHSVAFLADVRRESGDWPDAIRLWQLLATTLDPVRTRYWRHQIATVSHS